MRRSRSHLALAVVLACAGALALRLSAGDRGPVALAVLALLGGGVLWHLVQLGRRLHDWGGARALWHLQRTLLFWVIGLLNTAFARPDAEFGWRQYVGWTLLAIAVLDTLLLARAERRAGDGGRAGSAPDRGVGGADRPPSSRTLGE